MRTRARGRLLELLVILLVVLGARSLAHADALGLLTGTIASGGVPARVSVVCGAVARAAVTDARGAFSIAGLPPTTCLVTASAPGFAAGATQVTIAAGGTATVSLTLRRAPAPADTKPKDRPKTEAVAPAVAPMPSAPPPPSRKRAFDGRAVGPAKPRMLVQQPGPRQQDPGSNTEAYDRIDENPFHRVTASPLSTFSVDVDTASYANTRRFLAGGTLPPKDAVRLEEMINYFAYAYPAPARGEPFSITTDVTTSPWNTNNKLVRIGLAASAIAAAQVPPRNLVFLLDVSGSMNEPTKLPLLKQAMDLLVANLRPEDKIAIVTYAGNAGLALPATSGKHKDVIRDAMFRLEPGGSTNGAAGIQLAYAIAEANQTQGSIDRVILATDGDFNVGTTSQGDLTRLIEQERDKGVALTVLGFGMGNYKDGTIEKLADRGNGNYAYIDTLHEARKVLVKEAGATLVTVAKDVKLQVEFNPATVAGYRLIGYENRMLRDQDFNDDKKDAGDIGAGHTVTALYEIVPAGQPVPGATVDALTYQRPAGAAASGDLMTVKIRYKAPQGATSKLLSRAVGATSVPLAQAPADLRWATAIASFGMMLRDAPNRGQLTWAQVLAMAKGALGADAEGYRAEAVRLIETASRLKPVVAAAP